MAYKSYLLFERRELEANGEACQQRTDFALNLLKNIIVLHTEKSVARAKRARSQQFRKLSKDILATF